MDGHLLIPGFVNSHFHSHDVLAKGSFETMSLEQWGLVSGPIGSNRSVEEVRLRTIVGAIECARNGITTVQDFAVVAPLKSEYLDAIAEAYASVGIRVVLSVSLRDLTAFHTLPWADEFVAAEHRSLFGSSIDGDTQLAFVAEQMDRIGTDNGRLGWAISPSAPQRCTFAFLKRIGSFARSRDLRVFTHVYESRLQRLHAKMKLTDFKGSEIEYLDAAGLLGDRTTLAHGVWPDADEIRRIADTGAGVVLNMLSNLKLRNGVAPLSAYRRAGVALSLGCDNCSCSDLQSMIEVMRLYCLLGAISEVDTDQPTAVEAIKLGTIGGARAAGKSSEIGEIEVGMDADLVALDLSDPSWQPFNSAARQLVFSETGRSITDVWVGGRRVVTAGRCTFVDENAIRAQLEEIMPSVRSEISKLAKNAAVLAPALGKINKRAVSANLGYHRYLPD